MTRMKKLLVVFLVVFCACICGALMSASSCGNSEEEPNDEHVHTYSSEITTAATCTEKGVRTYTCTVCGDTYTEEIEATGHSYDEGKVTTEAGCTTKGVKTYTCTACGNTYTEDIEATGHTYSDSWSYDGTTHYHAATCGHDDEKTDVYNHVYDSGIIMSHATTTDGSTIAQKATIRYTCTYCGYYYDDTDYDEGLTPVMGGTSTSNATEITAAGTYVTYIDSSNGYPNAKYFSINCNLTYGATYTVTLLYSSSARVYKGSTTYGKDDSWSDDIYNGESTAFSIASTATNVDSDYNISVYFSVEITEFAAGSSYKNAIELELDKSYTTRELSSDEVEWYKYTPGENGYYVLEATSSSVQIYLYGEGDYSGYLKTSGGKVGYSLTTGSTYYYMVYNYDSSSGRHTGTAQFSFSKSNNDGSSYDTAIHLDVSGEGQVLEAQELWYCYVATGGGKLTMSSNSSDTSSTYITNYTSSSAAGSQITSDDTTYEMSLGDVKYFKVTAVGDSTVTVYISFEYNGTADNPLTAAGASTSTNTTSGTTGAGDNPTDGSYYYHYYTYTYTAYAEGDVTFTAADGSVVYVSQSGFEGIFDSDTSTFSLTLDGEESKEYTFYVVAGLESGYGEYSFTTKWTNSGNAVVYPIALNSLLASDGTATVESGKYYVYTYPANSSSGMGNSSSGDIVIISDGATVYEAGSTSSIKTALPETKNYVVLSSVSKDATIIIYVTGSSLQILTGITKDDPIPLDILFDETEGKIAIDNDKIDNYFGYYFIYTVAEAGDVEITTNAYVYSKYATAGDYDDVAGSSRGSADTKTYNNCEAGDTFIIFLNNASLSVKFIAASDDTE